MNIQFDRTCLAGACRRSLAAFIALLAGVSFFASETSFAAIVVPVVGTAPQSFDSAPVVAEWATILTGAPGSAGTVTNTTEMDTLVQSLAASNFVASLPSTATLPPSTNSAARHNTSGLFVQTQTTTVAAAVLVAQLENGGPNVSDLTVSYDLQTLLDAGEVSIEEVPGHRVYYSLTGALNSWNPIGTFSSAGPIIFSVPLGTWATGSPLYLLWADDNAAAAGNTGETAYAIDNIAFTPVPEPGSIVLGVLGLISLVALGRRCR